MEISRIMSIFLDSMASNIEVCGLSPCAAYEVIEIENSSIIMLKRKKHKLFEERVGIDNEMKPSLYSPL